MSGMHKRQEPYLEIADEIIKGAGGRYVLSHGTRHPYIQWTVQNVTRKAVFPGSASDWRSLKNWRAQLVQAVKSVLNADGPHLTIPASQAVGIPAYEPYSREKDMKRNEDSTFPRKHGETQKEYYRRRYREDPVYRAQRVNYQREWHRKKAEEDGRPYKPRKRQVPDGAPVIVTPDPIATPATVVTASVDHLPSAKSVTQDAFVDEMRREFDDRIAIAAQCRLAASTLIDCALTLTDRVEDKALSRMAEALAGMLEHRAMVTRIG